METYKIVFSNGTTQIRNMVDQLDWECFNNKLHYLQRLMSVVPKDERSFEKISEIEELKKEMTKKFGDYFFTSGSPIAHSIQTGILVLPDAQGGPQPCSVTRI